MTARISPPATSATGNSDNAEGCGGLPSNLRPELEKLCVWLTKCASTLLAIRATQGRQKPPLRQPVAWTVAPPSESEHHPVLGYWDRPSAIRVSIETYVRALRILNDLVTTAVDRGLTVSADLDLVRFSSGGVGVPVKITEACSPDPTGRLRVSVFENLTQAIVFEDAVEAALEGQLADIIIAVVRGITVRKLGAGKT